jgi:baculoviral IAP repeat-containing protein 6
MNSDSRQAELQSSNSDTSRTDQRKEKDLWDWGLGMNLGMEFLSVAAGVTAKDKRLKDVKNQANSLKTKDLFSVFSEYFY